MNPLIVPLKICPVAPTGVAAYTDQISGMVLWSVLWLFGIAALVSVGAILVGRATHSPHLSKGGIIGLAGVLGHRRHRRCGDSVSALARVVVCVSAAVDAVGRGARREAGDQGVAQPVQQHAADQQQPREDAHQLSARERDDLA